MDKVDNITSGPITRTVVSLALPVTLGMFMQFALSSTDYFWVGKLGATAQDAVTTAMVITWTIYAVFSIVTVGVTALVSRFIGARDLDQVKYYIKQGMAMSLTTSPSDGATRSKGVGTTIGSDWMAAQTWILP